MFNLMQGNYFCFADSFSVIDILGSVPIIIDLRKEAEHVQSEKATIASRALMILFFFWEREFSTWHDIGSFAIAGARSCFL